MFQKTTYYLLIIIGTIVAHMGCKMKSMKYYMLVGTYSDKGSNGIYVFTFDGTTGEIKQISTDSHTENPSYITISGDRLFAVSETGGQGGGSVSAYRFDRQNGSLHLLNSMHTGGDHPCYVEADAGGRFVAVANYSGGSVAVFETDASGKLMSRVQLMQHEGGSVNPDRQQGPHAHQATFTPDNTLLLVPDLGKDRVMIYRFDKEAAEPLKLQSEIVCPPGSGPRHVAFHPQKNFAYLIQELKPAVVVYSFDDGHFVKVQEVQAWEEGFEGKKDGAAIKVSPDGRYLYASNRGEQNTIGIYRIDENSGRLSTIAFQPVGGAGPRDFSIDPSGTYLVVANQQSNNLTIFARDAATGLLSQPAKVELPIPVCVQFTDMTN